MNLDKDFISKGILKAQENTWGNRYNNVLPDINMDSTKSILTLTAGNFSCDLDDFDEIVLTIVYKFLFCPVWLIKQFYKTWIFTADCENVVEEKIDSWINVGLVWKESTVTGMYIRPTYNLFNLFGSSPENFTNIPFNTLTHTISEEKIMFDVMTKSDSVKSIFENNYTLSRVSELGFNIEESDDSGTNIIAEPDFRNPYLYNEKGIMELSNTEHRIDEAIKGDPEGSIITPELENFNQFTLIKKINNTGTIKKDYLFHIPDLIIPVIRNNGKPQSIAIEVELTNKRAINYKETMNRYKDNNKFGAVYWFVSSPNTMQALKNAYEEVGGTGKCKTYTIEFIIPYPEI